VQLGIEQSIPDFPEIQKHVPFLQIPDFEQSLGQGLLSHAFPKKGYSQKHSPFKHFPLLEQFLGHSLS